MADIRTLREAVEAGAISTDLIMDAFGHGWDDVLVLGAFDGSLDAAKALHDALLPGWRFWVWTIDGAAFHVDVVLHDEPEVGASGPTPARAWLIAILKALEARDNG